ncbi:MAG: Ig-like domain-containing protein [Deltaproteobacteria bacterium]|nr:Ig-like domain-containing protein [Deltaproteobacteria bacterium]
MILKRCIVSACVIVSLLVALPAQAIQTIGPRSLQNGYPVWFGDNAGFPVGFCLDAACIPDPVQAGNRFSEQVGFNGEAFYWMADMDLGNPAGLGLMVMAMEAAWAILDPANGDQFPFGRIRFRIDVLVPGSYTVTHPFGQATVVVPAVGPGPEITDANFSVLGGDIAGTVADVPPFAGVLGSGITHFFSVAGIGAPAPGALFTGAGLMASSNAGGSLPARTTFSVTGPLNAFGPGISTLSTNQVLTMAGRAFDPGPNTAPVLVADAAIAMGGRPIVIDPLLNDTDVVGAGNVHGLNPKATALVGGVAGPKTVTVGGTVLTFGADEVVTTAGGNTVTKNPDGTFQFHPQPAFTGVDTFQYVVQDTGGLISGQTLATDPVVPATVTVTVETLAVTDATFSPKTVKWTVSGTSSAANGTVITVFGAPTADPARVLGTATVTNGSWRFAGKAALSPAGGRQVTARSATSALVTAAAAPLVIR